MLTIAAGSSSSSINVLLPATLEVTSPMGSLTAGEGLEAAASSLVWAACFYSETLAITLSVPIESLAEGLGGGDEGAGLRVLCFSASSHLPIRLVNSPPKNV